MDFKAYDLDMENEIGKVQRRKICMRASNLMVCNMDIV